MDPRTLAGIALSTVLLGALAWPAAEALRPEIEREQRQVCQPLSPDASWQPRPARDFTLKDPRGRAVSLSEYQGKVVFLNFWATWCPPCRDEMDSMLKLASVMSKRSDFAVVMVSEDKSWKDVLDFFPDKESRDSAKRVTFLMDDDWKVAHDWRTMKLPETYLIDKTGKVRHYIINKRDWSSSLAQTCIDSLF